MAKITGLLIVVGSIAYMFAGTLDFTQLAVVFIGVAVGLAIASK